MSAPVSRTWSCADVVDASAAALIHPHVAASGAAAECPVAALLHLSQLEAGDRLGDLAGSVVHAVVASEVAGVVVSQRRVNRDERLEHPIGDEVGHELAVVEDLVVSAEVRVLVLDGVEAVRADGDDLLDVVAGEGLDVLLAMIW